ncbi:potassium-transporting ATPase subunit KdpC [Campylobacter estrildidarum]|uniref:Potassium-transporting ATPase KdpC subunit n=1 Tax=Campylobacter estrildidarum TaxID=2510189 RepID=A0A4U7BUC4_9BACT|nr:potassium-transporting ATPase subunit KdpC [Campylobacter estrildidarum]TKX31957.1 potassium-transporting ATPase subunit C [Campylobacter estrildidarum]
MIRTLFSFFIVMFVLCCVIYPFALNEVARFIFPYQASGSLIDKNGQATLDINKAVGSKLLGQFFNKPYFLHGRSSAINYNISDTNQSSVNSGGFNYAMSNPVLKERIENDLNQFLKQNPNVSKKEIPIDLLTSSASGLDPHISKQAAWVQIPRIVKFSKLSQKQVEEIINNSTEDKFLGIFGETKVNVLKANIAINKAMKKSKNAAKNTRTNS